MQRERPQFQDKFSAVLIASMGRLNTHCDTECAGQKANRIIS